MPSTHVSLLRGLRDDNRRDERWAVFRARYHRVIFRWCVRRGLQWDAAEDLTQEVLLKLFQHLPAYRHDPARGRFRGWLKAVVNNALTDFWRRAGGDAVGGEAFQARAAALASPEAAVELSTAIEGHARVAAAAVVRRVRAKLKETTWEAFYQVMVEGRPGAEAAAGLNLSVASVYKATYRAKQMLLQESRDAFTPRGPEPVSGPGGAGETPS
jgi:RNA polymerase sigma-70 factor (ECF subfamily)